MAPLIAFNMDEWAQHYAQLGVKGKEIPWREHVAYTSRLTCPQVALIAAQQGNETTVLTYRTISVGTLINDYRADLYDFNSESAGEVYDLRIELDNNDALITRVIPPDQWSTVSYTAPMAFMKRFLGDHRTAVFTTKEHENEKIKAYRETINNIEKSAEHFCR